MVEGMVQGILEGKHALQQQVQGLQANVTNLTDEIEMLRLVAGKPSKRCPSSDFIPASTEQLPACEQLRPGVCIPQLCSGPSLQPAPSTSSCIEVRTFLP